MFSASAPAFRWGQLVDGGVRGYGLAVDEDENCYVAGSLLGATALFGANVATNVAMGRSDVFVAKFDRHGSNLWVKTAGGDQSEEGRGIAVDKSGNVYVAGHINSPVATFGATNLTRQGNQDAFLAKYDTDGNFVWVRQGRNVPGQSAYGSAVFIESTNVYFAGGCAAGIEFGSIALTNTGVFCLRYDEDGNKPAGSMLGHAPAGSGASSPYVHDLYVDTGGNLYLAFQFSGAEFYLNSTPVTSSGTGGLFVKWDPNGNLLWFKQATGEMWGLGRGIKVRPDGDVVVSGGVRSSWGPGVQGAFDGVPVETDFVARLSSSGEVKWVKSISTAVGESHMALDLAGNTFVGGAIAPGGVELDGQFFPNASTVLVPAVTKLDSAGNVAWVKSGGSDATNGYGYNAVWGIGVGKSGATYISGYAQSSLTFDAMVATIEGTISCPVARIDPEAPALTIAPQTGGYILSWSTNQIGFSLEACASIGGEWTPMTNVILRSGDSFTCTNEASGMTRFFRLRLDD